MDLTLLSEPLIDKGFIPDVVLRRGIKYLLSTRAFELNSLSVEEADERKIKFVTDLRRKQNIAIHTAGMRPIPFRVVRWLSHTDLQGQRHQRQMNNTMKSQQSFSPNHWDRT